jgi:hypothetical protein
MSRRIAKHEAEALATFVTRLRPDWDHPGIVAAIVKAIDKGGPFDIAHALVTLAEDDQLRSPGLLASDGRHWLRRDGKPTGPRLSNNVPCPDHPEQDMPCQHVVHRGDMTPEQIREHIALALTAAAANPYVRPEVRRARAQEAQR